MEPVEIFREFLKSYIQEKPWGFQKELSKKTGIKYKYLNSYINGTATLSESNRIKISNVLGLEYDEVLAAGRKIEAGVHETMAIWDSIDAEVVPIDPATRILREVLEETGIKIDDAQKQIIVNILKIYLQTTSENARKIAKDLVDSMPEESKNGG